MSKMFMYSNEMLNYTTPWYGGDTEQLFNESIKSYPNYRWKTEPINYSFNEFGYRMKKVADVEWDNYFISLGCSCTMGIGLSTSLTWPGLISTETGLDVVNLGKTGSSVDFAATTFIHSIDKIPKLPKMVIVAWPPIFRFLWFKQLTQPVMSMYHFKPQPKGHEIPEPCIQEDELSKRFALLTEIDYHLLTKWSYTRKSIKLICEGLGIKFLDFSFFADYKDELFRSVVDASDNEEYMWNEFWARDRSHPGPAHHAVAKDYLMSCIK